MNSDEVTDDHEDEEYDSDFIDDSEPVDMDTYNSEWAELYGIPARKPPLCKYINNYEFYDLIINFISRFFSHH